MNVLDQLEREFAAPMSSDLQHVVFVPAVHLRALLDVARAAQSVDVTAEARSYRTRATYPPGRNFHDLHAALAPLLEDA